MVYILIEIKKKFMILQRVVNYERTLIDSISDVLQCILKKSGTGQHQREN